MNVMSNKPQAVRGLMFDGLLMDAEVAPNLTAEGMGGVATKTHMDWCNNFFMILRSWWNALAASVHKIPKPKHSATLMSTSRVVRGHDQLCIANISAIINASPNESFILHQNGHAAGMRMDIDGTWTSTDVVKRFFLCCILNDFHTRST